MEHRRGDASPGRGADALSASERAMLDLEALPYKYAGAKQEAIRERLHLSSAAYYQRLNRLIDSDAALAYDPMLVRRLRGSRSRGADAVRASGRGGAGRGAGGTVAEHEQRDGRAPEQSPSAQEREEPHA